MIKTQLIIKKGYSSSQVIIPFIMSFIGLQFYFTVELFILKLLITKVCFYFITSNTFFSYHFSFCHIS